MTISVTVSDSPVSVSVAGTGEVNVSASSAGSFQVGVGPDATVGRAIALYDVSEDIDALSFSSGNVYLDSTYIGSFRSAINAAPAAHAHSSGDVYVPDMGLPIVTTDVDIDGVVGSIDNALQSLKWPVLVTYTQITSDRNNYDISQADGGFARIYSDAARSITGFAEYLPVSPIRLFNAGSYSITLKHQSSSSTAGSRIICPSGVDYVLVSNASVVAYYDTYAGRWRVG